MNININKLRYENNYKVYQHWYLDKCVVNHSTRLGKVDRYTN